MLDSVRIIYLQKVTYPWVNFLYFFFILYSVLSSIGCYPRCPPNKPIYNEETKECVTEDKCGCYLEDGTYVPPWHEVPTKENCTTWYIKITSSNSENNLCMLSLSFTLLGLKQIEMQLQLMS